MDRFPRTGDLVSFQADYEVYTFIESTDTTIKKGTVLEILNITIDNGNAPDFSDYTLYLGIKIKGEWKILKITPNNMKPGIITYLPNTPAAEVLFKGKSET